jgi:hypothetical protein
MTIGTEFLGRKGLLVEEPRHLLSILRRCRSDLDSGHHPTVTVHCKVLLIGQHDSEPPARRKRCLGIGSRDPLAIWGPASLRVPTSRASRVETVGASPSKLAAAVLGTGAEEACDVTSTAGVRSGGNDPSEGFSLNT